jgi:hypothetical protein
MQYHECIATTNTREFASLTNTSHATTRQKKSGKQETGRDARPRVREATVIPTKIRPFDDCLLASCCH